MNVLITGVTGFVGRNLSNYLTSYNYTIQDFNKETLSTYDNEIVIHLAGKAHDTKNSTLQEEYYLINTELTINVFDNFLKSKSKVFIFLSSVKSIADSSYEELNEDFKPNPITDYGKSKLLAEEYILGQKLPHGKRVYILRPCMIHGPGNKGNLNLLFKIIKKGIPWPLGAFNNYRSFCSIENLCFVIKEIIDREDFPTGTYNIADNDPISTNELIRIIAFSVNKKLLILKIPKFIIVTLSKIGDFFNLSFNSERLSKLTENYLVSNKKILKALKKNLPVSSKEGLIFTIQSMNH